MYEISSNQFKDYILKLKKDELIKLINDYNVLASIYNFEKQEDTKAKKDVLVNILDENNSAYLKYFVMSLDNKDFDVLSNMLYKKCNIEFLNIHKDFINYLLDKRIVWQKESLEIPEDIYKELRSLVKNKEVIKYVKENDKAYKLADGIVIAYGVIDRKSFDNIISVYNLSVEKLEYYYKKEYVINNKMVVSNKLSNKKKINAYLKNKNYKEFTIKEFVDLGNSLYHHNIKSYKNFIKMLKVNYVFKKKDIEFVDVNIVIPYLYNSINEEEIANKNLEETVINLFEFKGDKLKLKMLNEIKAIRLEFPLWELRGYTKESASNE